MLRNYHPLDAPFNKDAVVKHFTVFNAEKDET